MTVVELRRRLKKRIDSLPPKRLQVAADFVAYLDERPDNAATRELERIPPLLERILQAEREFAGGKATPVEQLRRKY